MNEEQLASDLTEMIKLNAINIEYFQLALKEQVEICKQLGKVCKQLSEICFKLSKSIDELALLYNEHDNDELL